MLYALWIADILGLGYLYADQWRIMETLLTQPFPANLLESQNDHHPIIPSLLHYINLFVLKQNQTPVMWLGIAIALLCCVFLIRTAYLSAGLTSQQKIVLSGLALMTILHTANGRLLFYANDSVHSYLVLLPLLIGIWLIFRQAEPNIKTALPESKLLLLLVCLGTLAVFSFGTGAVVLPTFCVALLLAHKSLSVTVKLALYTVLITLVYLYLLPSRTIPNSAELESPLITWVAYVPKIMSAPLAAMVDNNFAVQRLTEPLAATVRELTESVFGPILFVAAFVYLTFLTLGILFDRTKASSTEGYYLSLAISMVAVGVLISFARKTLVHYYPENTTDSRFFVWSSFFWLCFVSLLYLRLGRSKNQFARMNASMVAAFFILLLLASSTAPKIKENLRTDHLRALDSTLRASMGIHAGYWEFLGIRAKQIALVAEGFRARNVPLLDSFSDRIYLQQFPHKMAAATKHLEGNVWFTKLNQTSGKTYAEVRIRTSNESDTIYVLSKDSRVTGIFRRTPHITGLANSFRKSQKAQPLNIYLGFIHPFDADTCYHYAHASSEGKFVTGPFILKGNITHNSRCPE